MNRVLLIDETTKACCDFFLERRGLNFTNYIIIKENKAF